MQLHYVVMYNTETKKWSLDWDMSDNLDGNCYTDDLGFFFADDEMYPNSVLIDQRCVNMLNALLPIWPEVDDSHVN